DRTRAGRQGRGPDRLRGPLGRGVARLRDRAGTLAGLAAALGAVAPGSARDRGPGHRLPGPDPAGDLDLESQRLSLGRPRLGRVRDSLRAAPMRTSSHLAIASALAALLAGAIAPGPRVAPADPGGGAAARAGPRHPAARPVAGHRPPQEPDVDDEA